MSGARIPTPEERSELAKLIDDGHLRRDPISGRIELSGREARIVSRVVPGLRRALDVAETALEAIARADAEAAARKQSHYRGALICAAANAETALDRIRGIAGEWHTPDESAPARPATSWTDRFHDELVGIAPGRWVVIHRDNGLVGDADTLVSAMRLASESGYDAQELITFEVQSA